MTAGLAIQATTGLCSLRIGPWADLGVLGLGRRCAPGWWAGAPPRDA